MPQTTRYRLRRPLATLVALVPAAAAAFAQDAPTPAHRVNLTGTVVVVNQQSDSVTLIDLKKMEAYRHVPVVAGPHEAAVAPDGKSVVVTNYNKQGVGQQKTLSLIALPSGDTIKTIDLGEYKAPHDVRWVDAQRVVVTSEANQALLLVNVETGKIERVFDTKAGVSHMLAISADRTRLYCSNMRDGSVSAFDFQTGAKIKDVPTGKECEGVGVTPDGRWVWAGNRAEDTISIIDTKTLEVVKKIPSPRAIHSRRQAGANSPRPGVLTGRRRRRQPDAGQVDPARNDEGGRALDRRGLPAPRQPARVRDRAQRQLDGGAGSEDRRDPRPRRGSEQPRRRLLLCGAASVAGSLLAVVVAADAESKRSPRAAAQRSRRFYKESRMQTKEKRSNPPIVPCLWMDDQAQAAADLYTRNFPGGRVTAVSHYPEAGDNPSGRPPGSVLTVEIEIAGQGFTLLNGGPQFQPNPTISFFARLKSADEVDRLYAALAKGGKELMELGKYPWSDRYGWVQDPYGVSWQVMIGHGGPGEQTIAPCLMFAGAQHGKAARAIDTYPRVFPNSHVDDLAEYGPGEGEAGTIKHGRFVIAGQDMVAMDSHLHHGKTFDEGVSLQVLCADQAEIDHYWNGLAEGGEHVECGWLKDRFGVSWQVAPKQAVAWMTSGDTAARDRVFAALLKMKKLDIAALKAAFEGP
jgi:YVTN family beta-propeller protein